MTEIDDLEERAAELQRKLTASGGSPGPQDGDAPQQDLHELLERIEQKRIELTRVSNACRRPHPNV
jgi:hypothetical protein